MGKDAVFLKLKELLISEFELEPGAISPEKLLQDDLDLDSLDEVDLVVSLKDYISKEIDYTLLKDALTVGDIVDLLHPIWKS
jgi:acyl carrier protein